jgi:hypothetical protein
MLRAAARTRCRSQVCAGTGLRWPGHTPTPRHTHPRHPRHRRRRRYKTQSFNAVASQTNGSLLLLSAISILIPTAAQQLGTGGGDDSGPDVLLDGLLGGGMPHEKVGPFWVCVCVRVCVCVFFGGGGGGGSRG